MYNKSSFEYSANVYFSKIIWNYSMLSILSYSTSILNLDSMSANNAISCKFLAKQNSTNCWRLTYDIGPAKVWNNAPLTLFISCEALNNVLMNRVWVSSPLFCCTWPFMYWMAVYPWPNGMHICIISLSFSEYGTTSLCNNKMASFPAFSFYSGLRSLIFG